MHYTKLYTVHNFIQDMRARLVAEDIVLNERDARKIYHAVFETLQQCLITHKVYTLPYVCKLTLTQAKPRQYTVRSYKARNEHGPLRTVLSTEFRLKAQLNRTLRSLLTLSEDTPTNDKRLQRAIAASCADDEDDVDD